MKAKPLLKNWWLRSKNTIINQSKHILALIYILFSFIGLSQVNLVGNPSFEVFHSGCTSPNFVSKLKYWGSLDSSASFGAGLNYNICYGNVPYAGPGLFQHPRSGSGLIRLQAYCTNPCSYNTSRGYPKNRLLNGLISGKQYCVKMFVNLENASPIAIDALQILLGDVSLDTITYINTPLTYLTPQITNTVGIIMDTLNWIEVKGTFVANGTEKYLVIGDFKSDASTSASSSTTGVGSGVWSEYMIDDVSVIDFNLPAYAGPDKNITLGDSAFIGRPPEVGLECVWATGTTTIGTGGGLWVKPTTTGTFSYVVTQNICGNIKKDTVNVNISLGINENIAFAQSIGVYPQPAKDIVTISLNNYYEPTVDVKLTDITGKLISSSELIVRNGKTQLETIELSNGVYILQIKNSKGQFANKRLVIAK